MEQQAGVTIASLVTSIVNLVTGFIPSGNFATILFVGVIVTGAIALVSRLKRLGR